MASDEQVVAQVDTGETVVLEVELDIQDVEQGVKTISSEITGLRKTVNSMGVSISKAFKPAVESMGNMQIGMSELTDAIATATEAMQGLKTTSAEAPAERGVFDSIIDTAGEISQAIDTVDSKIGDIESTSETIKKYADIIEQSSGDLGGILVALLPNTSAVVSMIGSVFSSVAQWVTGTLVPAITGALTSIAGALGISVGWVVAIIAAVIAAIAAVIIYWDEIKLFFTETLPQLWAQLVEWVSGIAVSVAEVFSTIVASIVGFFTECWNWLVATFAGIGEWIQENIIQPIMDFFTPLVEWFMTLFESIKQTVSDAFYNIGVIISGCWEILQAVWGVVSEWFNTNVIQPVAQFFNGLWSGICNVAISAWEGIKGAFSAVAEWFNQYVIQPVANFFKGLWEGFKNAAVQAWEGVKSVFSKVASFFKDVFSKAWAGVVAIFAIAGEIFVNIKNGILTAFKTIVNGIISGINKVVAVPFNGINSALSVIRNISILGLTPFAGLGSISVPQIPYLAKGAVLPANRPFLAVVGDQRHGTNVEAPLSTIQEAVALVMDDHIAAMMAGFQALLNEQRATRQTIEGIQIGDTVIGQACDRYRSKMAVVHGGW